ncbi:FAD-binding protein [Abyssibius alkaniclasticus]|uniref:FAD-binding oxidoreductase n=1 Tax=Abyssibius alkaniclasticus TaxID=2881234 RepID=UPI002363527C|nr:FAD-linked oxidase C-terminal domain-containing protein [Abyssibius alkaniclasticus]UPH69939.1 FAD-binding protein [Abyssibius alkaniclasticus]
MSIDTAIEALRNLLGTRLSTNSAIMDQHGQNEAYFPVTPPDAVAFPTSTAEVSQIVKICATHDCPVVAYGTGTALEGHQLAARGGVVVDLMRMDKVLAVHAEDLDCTVQPGVTREALNTELRATGLFFPIDPGANASLGGMAATRASGTAAVRYGTMRDSVLALEVVMADGQIIRTGTRARKSSSGYDLTHLFVGSEGTLGIITELTLKLQAIPEATSAATCRFASFEDAVNTVITTIQSNIPMARIEFVDEMMARGFNLHAGVNLPEMPHLFVEFNGSKANVQEQAAAFGEIANTFGAEGFEWAHLAEDRSRLWKMRHNAYYAQKAHRPGARVKNTDICVPISMLAEAVAKARADATALGLTVSMVGHVGDGNFHCGISVDHDNPDEMARAQEFSNRLNGLALSLGGTISGEHGIGMGKTAYMEAEHGPALDVMRKIKASLDPQNIMNPGKLLPGN